MGSVRKHNRRASRTDNILFTEAWGPTQEGSHSRPHEFSSMPYHTHDTTYEVNGVYMLDMPTWFSYPEYFWIENETDAFRHPNSI